jgi:hypothetical protein
MARSEKTVRVLTPGAQGRYPVAMPGTTKVL